MVTIRSSSFCNRFIRQLHWLILYHLQHHMSHTYTNKRTHYGKWKLTPLSVPMIHVEKSLVSRRKPFPFFCNFLLNWISFHLGVNGTVSSCFYSYLSDWKYFVIIGKSCSHVWSSRSASRTYTGTTPFLYLLASSCPEHFSLRSKIIFIIWKYTNWPKIQYPKPDCVSRNQHA